MANYYCTARTNYFHVKNVDLFNKWIEQFSEIEVVKKMIGLENGFGLLFDEAIPTTALRDKKNEAGEVEEVDVDIDFMDELADHLADDEVAIYMEAGAEKRRFVIGYAVAINNKKESESISLDDIYAKAKTLGKNVTKVEY